MKSRHRLILCALLITIIVFPLGASVTGGTGGLRTASTEHFDIIYQDSSAQTAALLFENCEEVYASLVSFFGVDPHLHLPVVVTSRYKSLNAYFTNYTANHIVMFDTVADIGQLSNYPQTILYIFRHELTHAFQFNIRGPFMEAMASVFGDLLSLSPILYMYPSLSEGGAVLSESVDGYGRLNDSYAMQIVKQAKIEGLFPTWLEVAGARDTYPSGLLYYNFAAAFLEYLSITYGYDKVTSLYSDFSRLSWSTFVKIKRVFGIPVDQAWQQFFAWVQVPEDVAEGEVLASRPENGSYASAVLAPDGSLFVYDYASLDILRFPSDLSGCTKVLNLPTDEQHLSISADGSMMLASCVSSSYTKVRLYSLKNGKASFVRDIRSPKDSSKDIRKGSFVSLDGTEYILLYSNAGQNTYLDLYDVSGVEPVEGKTLCLGYDVVASDFIDIGDGKVAFIISQASHQNIAVLNLSDMSVSLISNPDDISILSLSEGTGDVLCFAWCHADAKATNLCRYGEAVISADGAQIRLSDCDVSGGVTRPIRINDSVLYTARYFEHLKLSTIAVDDLNLSDAVSYGYEGMTDAPSPDITALSESSSKYRAIRYFKDGILLPLAVIEFGGSESYALGATWITTDPTETYTHQLAASYLISMVAGSYRFTSDNVIPYSVYMSVMYGTGVFASPDSLQAGEILLDSGIDIAKSFELAPSHTLGLGGSFEFAAMDSPQSDMTYGISTFASMTYSYSRKTGMNHYDTFGFSTKAYLSDLRPGASMTMRFPRLLWWKCNGPDVTNLPFRFTVGAIFDPVNETFAMDGSVTVVLYSREIQRAVSFLGLFFQRFTVDMTYNATFISGIDAFGHTLSATAAFTLSPVLGEYLTQVKVRLGATFVTDFENCQVRLAFGTDY